MGGEKLRTCPRVAYRVMPHLKDPASRHDLTPDVQAKGVVHANCAVHQVKALGTIVGKLLRSSGVKQEPPSLLYFGGDELLVHVPVGIPSLLTPLHEHGAQ
ncbi:hypothetical protein ACN27B_11990 [Micromonospora sp. WMMD754]|uniref:hypothetical protein n=1 Tax=unclassified Micromonospora TaxID=2617518 RepID=UPI0012FD9206|nr:hypothetical protein [Micromonospora sp. WMMA2032]